MVIQTFKIENKAEADSFLADLLAKPEYRSIAEVERRAHSIVIGDELKMYFIDKGAEMLRK